VSLSIYYLCDLGKKTLYCLSFEFPICKTETTDLKENILCKIKHLHDGVEHKNHLKCWIEKSSKHVMLVADHGTSVPAYGGKRKSHALLLC
jgi:hypothetical protein